MSTAHKHSQSGDGHEHKAAPMVEEITDYEVLEIAVRELAIEHGPSPRRTTGSSPNGPNLSDRLQALAWSPKHGRTLPSRPVS